MATVKSNLQFIAYVKRKYPALYKQGIARMQNQNGLAGLGVTVEEMLADQNAFAEPSTGNSFSQGFANATNSLVDLLKNLAPSVIGYQQAKTCIDVNAARAKNNQPPIDCNAALTPQVNFGVSSQMQYLMYAVVGIGALYLFTRKR